MNKISCRKKTLAGAVALLITAIMVVSTTPVTAEAEVLETIILEEGFEAATMPPTGWYKSQTHFLANWKISGNPSHIHSGDYAAWVQGYSGSIDEWLVSPEIDLSSYEEWVDLTLDFWAYSRSDGLQSAWGQVWVYPDAPGVFNKLQWRSLADRVWSVHDEEVVWPGYGQREVTIDLGDYAGETIKIAFCYAGLSGPGGLGSDFAIDDISVFTGSLIPPTTIAITKFTAGSGSISAEISNTGNTSHANDVKWDMTAQGGILGRINVIGQGEIERIRIGEKETVGVSGIFGLGRIDVHIEAESEDALPESVERDISAFVFLSNIYFMDFDDD